MIEERLDKQLLALNKRYQNLFYSASNEEEIKRTRYLSNIKSFKIDRIIDDLRYRKYAKEHFSIEGNIDNDAQHKIDPSKYRIAVYSCIVGKYDSIIEPIYKEDDIDYLMFTDQDIHEKSAWKRVDIKEDPHYEKFSPSQLNRYIKIMQTEELLSYDYTVYVDGNIEIVSGISPLISEMSSCGLGVHYHRRRDCIYDEVVAVKHLKKISGEEMDTQLEVYRKEQFPCHYGMYENSILIRNNNDLKTLKLMEAWWKEFLRFPTRDQLSLPYVIWKSGYDKTSIHIMGHDVERNPRFNRLYMHNMEK